jgi:hypothetical protein
VEIIEPGHIYKLHVLDRPVVKEGHNDGVNDTLVFVNREPGKEHPGYQTQEVLRALIDRTMHCDNCLRWAGNDKIIHHLRMALVLHEARALERKTEKGIIQPETVYTSVKDGHFTLQAEGDDGACCPPASEDNYEYTNKPKIDPVESGKPMYCTRG